MKWAGVVPRLCFALAAVNAVGQTAGFTPRKDAAEIPSYTIVSIHKLKEAGAKQLINDASDGIVAQAVTLRFLIAEAYGFSLGQDGDKQVVGFPEWATTQCFDLRAKVEPAEVPKLAALKKADNMATSVQELATRTPSYDMLMLQRMLEDRFHVKIHYEQRVMPIYEMVAAKGGIKIKPVHAADPEHGSMSMSTGKFTAENVPMSFIPLMLGLAPELERPVVDKTGAAGSYDFTLHWSAMGVATNTTEVAGLFTAIHEQLGLKLNPSKGPVWVIVVDHAELPSEN